jgi:hypothetical protein
MFFILCFLSTLYHCVYAQVRSTTPAASENVYSQTCHTMHGVSACDHSGTKKTPLNIGKGKTNSAIRLRQMQECPKDPKFSVDGCAELWRICVNAEKQDRIGRHESLVASHFLSQKENALR